MSETEIDFDAVGKLRSATGAGHADAVRALRAASGDHEVARKALRAFSLTADIEGLMLSRISALEADAVSTGQRVVNLIGRVIALEKAAAAAGVTVVGPSLAKILTHAAAPKERAGIPEPPLCPACMLVGRHADGCRDADMVHAYLAAVVDQYRDFPSDAELQIRRLAEAHSMDTDEHGLAACDAAIRHETAALFKMIPGLSDRDAHNLAGLAPDTEDPES